MFSLQTITRLLVIIYICFPSEATYSLLGRKCAILNSTSQHSQPRPSSTSIHNRDQLLSVLSSKAENRGFYKTTFPQNSTSSSTAYGLFLCRGDVARDVCKACVAAATVFAVQSCSIARVIRPRVVIWYDKCMLRYSDLPLLSNTNRTTPNLNLPTVGNVSEQSGFNKVVATSIKELTGKVIGNARAGADLIKYFATKETPNIRVEGSNKSSTITLYSLGQCTPDLSIEHCQQCLRKALLKIDRYGFQGGQYLFPNCIVMYQPSPFYRNLTAAPPPDKAIPPEGRSKRPLFKIIVPSVVSLAVVLAALGYFFIGRRVRNKNSAQTQENAGNDINITVESLQFDLGTIEIATMKFSDNNKLGEGGFGEVFKGTFGNGQEIAVKRLSKSSEQGVQEFKEEVQLVAKLQHRNLVRFLGFCSQGGESLLVYEYMPNKTLEHFLFDPIRREQLNWSRRCVIIGGIARGILYLHEDSRPTVIHRDVRAGNILLDGNMDPKISNFGMARMFGVDDQTQGNNRRIVGTCGYMAPEFAMEGLYSGKSDVFSFGILLLEIITGRRNFLGFPLANRALPTTLLAYAWQLWNEGKGLELMDPLLKDSCSPDEFLRYIQIGLLCGQEDANRRPTMSSVDLMLKSETISLSIPERPAFFTGRYTNYLSDQIGASSQQ